MPYIYLDHEADVGIQAVGGTLEEAFEEGAMAMFNVMFDTSTIEEKKRVSIQCEARDIPLLFVEALNEILYKQDINGLALCRFEVGRIERMDGVFRLRGSAWGEPINLDKHTVKTEVKAATYSGLNYEEREGKHILQCILDV